MITKEIETSVLELPDIDKIHLIEKLVQSLDKPDAETTTLWIKESEKRYNAVKEGKVKTVPYEEVMNKVRK